MGQCEVGPDASKRVCFGRRRVGSNHMLPRHARRNFANCGVSHLTHE